MVEFKVQKTRRTFLSFKRIISTFRGKAAVLTTIFLAVCAIVVSPYALDFFIAGSTPGTSEDFPGVAAFMVGAVFALLAFISALCLIPLFLAYGSGKQARNLSEVNQATITIGNEDTWVAVLMPGTRFFDVQYLDRQYACTRDNVESLRFDAMGAFRFRARKMWDTSYRDQ